MIKTAYCCTNGQIRVGAKLPDEALPIICGPEKEIRKLIHATATLADDGKTWLVPDMHPANTLKENIDALIVYKKWINRRRSEARHMANGHTELCAKQLARDYGKCVCVVENFELRDPRELLGTISRLGRGAVRTTP